MATAASSARPARFALELEDVRSSRKIAFPLNPAAAHAPGIAFEGAVADRGRYRMALLADKRVSVAAVEVSVGEESLRSDSLRCLPSFTDGYQLRFEIGGSEDRQLFRDVFGFAKVFVTAVPDSGEPMCLQTEQIPCTSPIDDIRTYAVGMLDELCADGLAAAVRLAAADGDQVHSDRSALLGNGALALAESMAALAQATLPALLARGRRKSAEKAVLADARQVRRAGRRELEWMASGRAGLALSKLPTALKGPDGRSCIAARVRTSVPSMTYECEENAAVLTFFAEVAATSARWAARWREGAKRMRADAARLAPPAQGDDGLPVFMLLEEQSRRFDAAAARFDAAARKAAGAVRALTDRWGIEPGRGFRMPRRSKAFAELRPYRRCWAAMRVWIGCGASRAEARPTMIGLRSLSALHEVYCLAKMLQWFLDAGFEVAEVECVDDDPAASPRMNGRYVLKRADQTATLWFKPVFHSDERDEYGCGAHRVTAGGSSWEARGEDARWTPDFALKLEDGISTRFVVLDAKFSTCAKAKADYLDRCVSKYRTCTALEEGGVSCVWLLCGKEADPSLTGPELGPWASSRSLLYDGAAALSAQASSLPALMAKLGVRGGGSIEAPDTLASDEGAEGAAEPAVGEPVDREEADAVQAKDAPEHGTEAASALIGEDRQPKTDEPEHGPKISPEALDLLVRLAAHVDASSMCSRKMAGLMCSARLPLAIEGQVPKKDRSRYTAEVYETRAGTFHLRANLTPASLQKLKANVERFELALEGESRKARRVVEAVEEKGRAPSRDGGKAPCEPQPAQKPAETGEGCPPDIDPRAFDLLKRLGDMVSYGLESPRACEPIIATSHAILCPKPPKREAGRYTKQPAIIEGRRLHLYRLWDEQSLSKLSQVVDLYERASERGERPSFLDLLCDAGPDGAAAGEAGLPAISEAKKSAPAPKRRRAARGLSPEAEQLIRELRGLALDPKALETQKEGEKLRLSQPVLRKTRPRGPAGKAYTAEPLDYDGVKLYAYKDWRPEQLQKLRSAVASAKRKQDGQLDERA